MSVRSETDVRRNVARHPIRLAPSPAPYALLPGVSLLPQISFELARALHGLLSVAPELPSDHFLPEVEKVPGRRVLGRNDPSRGPPAYRRDSLAWETPNSRHYNRILNLGNLRSPTRESAIFSCSRIHRSFSDPTPLIGPPMSVRCRSLRRSSNPVGVAFHRTSVPCGMRIEKRLGI